VFTGIIQGQGRLTEARRGGRELFLRVQALFALDALVVGESVAVNGVCLSVESGADGSFTAYASEETSIRTTLGLLQPGALVNLERALALGERFGGHMVSGHVDCLAEVESVKDAGKSLAVRFRFPAEFAELVISKGSVALDGISLTVNNCGGNFLEVNVIPETRRVTSVAGWMPGVRVNMETDLIGKYVRHMLAPRRGGAASGMDEAFLREHGFI
jgi:riboflavin synthase